MAKFRIVYRDPPRASNESSSGVAPEEVESLIFEDAGDWIDFYSTTSPSRAFLVLRIRASSVERIEQVKE